MNEIDELFENQILELRRGVIILAALSQLSEPTYGYALLTKLEEGGLIVDAGTLYPLLRRLEKQGLLESEWNTEEVRPRKYYKMNKKGNDLYKKLSAEWLIINNNLLNMLKKGEKHG